MMNKISAISMRINLGQIIAAFPCKLFLRKVVRSIGMLSTDTDSISAAKDSLVKIATRIFCPESRFKFKLLMIGKLSNWQSTFVTNGGMLIPVGLLVTPDRLYDTTFTWRLNVI